MTSLLDVDRDVSTAILLVFIRRWRQLFTCRYLKDLDSLLLVHSSRSVTMRTYEGTASQSQNNSEDRNAQIAANQGATKKTSSIALETSRSRSQSDSMVRQTSKLHLSYRLIVTPRKFDVLEKVFAREAKLRGQNNMLVLRTSNFQGTFIRPIVPKHKHSITFIVHH